MIIFMYIHHFPFFVGLSPKSPQKNHQDFVKLTSEELESCHEGLRDMGLLRVLDTTEADQKRLGFWWCKK